MSCTLTTYDASVIISVFERLQEAVENDNVNGCALDETELDLLSNLKRYLEQANAFNVTAGKVEESS